MKRVLIPAVIAVLTTASLVALAGWNRSEARLQLTLTERELHMAPEPTFNSTGDSGLQLRLQFEHRGDPLDARNWLTEERLRALGFALDVASSAPDAAEAYARALPRLAWVAFEFGGDTWRQIERRYEMTRPPGMDAAPSRLVSVDASPSLDEMLARYPTGHLILRASIVLGYVPPQHKGPLVYGWIRKVIPSGVTIPRQLRSRVTGLADRATARYDVDLAVGRLGIPFIVDLRPRP